MEIKLNEDTQKWQKIAREYADNFLQPHEVHAELNKELPSIFNLKRNY